jgi:hypothetical protein
LAVGQEGARMVQSILTVVLSGVVAALVSFILSSKKETFLYKQKKAEDLFLAADRYIKILSGVIVLNVPYIKGKISEREVMDLLAKNHSQDEKASHAVLWMLTRFYFPTIEPALEMFDKKRSAIMGIISARRTEPVEYKVFDAAWGEFNEASDALLDAIVAQGKEFREIPIPFAHTLSRLGDSKPDAPPS